MSRKSQKGVIFWRGPLSVFWFACKLFVRSSFHFFSDARSRNARRMRLVTNMKQVSVEKLRERQKGARVRVSPIALSFDKERKCFFDCGSFAVLVCWHARWLCPRCRKEMGKEKVIINRRVMTMKAMRKRKASTNLARTIAN